MEVLVGKSSSRQLPAFFSRSIHAPIHRFESPNFLPTASNKRNNITRSVAYNVARLPVYLRSMHFIKEHIARSGADMVVNFTNCSPAWLMRSIASRRPRSASAISIFSSITISAFPRRACPACGG